MNKFMVLMALVSVVVGCSNYGRKIKTPNFTDDYKELMAKMGMDDKAPPEQPAGQFTAQSEPMEPTSDATFGSCPTVADHLDQRMKEGQSLLSRYDLALLPGNQYWHFFSRTTVNQVDFSKESYVRLVQDLTASGEITGWVKDLCKISLVAGYKTMTCKQLDASANRKETPPPATPTDSASREKACFFSYDYQHPNEKKTAVKGEYKFRNGVTVQATRIETTRTGEMTCVTADKTTTEGSATETSVRIVADKVPYLDNVSCESYTAIFSYSTVIDESGKIRDRNRNEVLEPTL